MIPGLRKEFNENFTKAKYHQFLEELENAFPGSIEFRVAETPVFIPRDFVKQVLDACESIVDLIIDPRFKEMTKRSIPVDFNVPGENDHSHFIAFDFGICVNGKGEYEPQLIEMQGFPSLFAYEVLLDDVFRKHFALPGNFHAYLSHFDRETYLRELREIIVGGELPENVILLEIFPEKQKTRVDFHATKAFTGINTVCLTKLIREGRKLYYEDGGRKIEVRRIYNRVILDDLRQQPPAVQDQGKKIFEESDVTWIPHPNWFYRISKYTMPFISHPFVPKTFFLNDLKQPPADLGNYVLKPLFSFAGQGVVIDVSQEDLDAVKDPENWILQKKVNYAGAIETPDIPAKCEIRIFYFWRDGTPRPIPANNLARLSKGKMIGVRYNKDKEWVGGSFCLFER